MAKSKIILQFDNDEDAKEVLNAIALKNEITWHHDKKIAMLKVIKKSMTVWISKSVLNTRKPLRL